MIYRQLYEKMEPQDNLKHFTQTGIVESNRQIDKHIQLYEKVKPQDNFETIHSDHYC